MTDVLTPMACPYESSSGPPLLPGLMAASVCRLSARLAEMIPLVTVGEPLRMSFSG